MDAGTQVNDCGATGGETTTHGSQVSCKHMPSVASVEPQTDTDDRQLLV